MSQIDPSSVIDVIRAWSPIRIQPPLTIEPGSDLAEDGLASSRYQVGYAAWSGIVCAMDPLDAMQSLVTQAQLVQCRPPLVPRGRTAPEGGLRGVNFLYSLKRRRVIASCGPGRANHVSWAPVDCSEWSPA